MGMALPHRCCVLAAAKPGIRFPAAEAAPIENERTPAM
jgi:hypothetical protein